jgi:hypothetical protein
MPIDSIVRASFQTTVKANQAVNSALVGDPHESKGNGPFQRIGTAAYSCSDADELKVAEAIKQLFVALANHALKIDFVSITMAHKEPKLKYRRVNRD